MQTTIDDRWLWLGLGAICIFGFGAVHHALQDVVELIKIDAPKASSQPDDDELLHGMISIDTLRILATSPTYHISRAATKMIVQRFMRNATAARDFIQDLRHPTDPEVQRTAGIALQYLGQYGNDTDPSNKTVPGSFLELSDLIAASREDADTERDDQQQDRDYDVPRNILGYLPPDDDLFDDRWVDQMLNNMRIGSNEGDRVEVLASAEEDIENLPPEAWEMMQANGARSWTRNRSVLNDDETARRRRRREAIVYHDGDGDVGPQDIIRPRR